MSDIDTEKLRTEIAEILKDADLSSTSAKKVRMQLEKKLGVQLASRRKEIDQLVMDYVNSKESEEDEEEEDESEEEEEKKEVKKKPAPAKKEKKKKKRTADSDEDEPKPKKRGHKKNVDSDEEEDEPKPKKRGRKKNADSDEDFAPAKKIQGRAGKGNGYTRAYRLSPALAKLMGEDSMPRHEVVKRVWALIKERNLYDKTNKQFAICDDDLYKVIGCKRFRTFGMMKYLKTHFYD